VSSLLLNLTDLSDEPLQGQIARQVRAYILAGDLHAGESLPSIRSLAREQRVSVITVQRAYEALMSEGLISSHPGKGYFVAAIDSGEKQRMARRRLREKLVSPVRAAMAEGLDAGDVRRALEDILQEEEKL
jgi:GntR family transcriptional regulator